MYNLFWIDKFSSCTESKKDSIHYTKISGQLTRAKIKRSCSSHWRIKRDHLTMLLILRKMAQCLLKHASPAKVRQFEAKVIKQQSRHLIPQETLAQCNKHCNNKKVISMLDLDKIWKKHMRVQVLILTTNGAPSNIVLLVPEICLNVLIKTHVVCSSVWNIAEL